MHTMGKWVVEKRKRGFRVSSKAKRKVHNHPLSFETSYYKIADVYYEENANRIVQMHNSFDGLLRMCKEGLSALEAEDGNMNNLNQWLFTREGMKSAIAEAESIE